MLSHIFTSREIQKVRIEEMNKYQSEMDRHPCSMGRGRKAKSTARQNYGTWHS